MSVPDRCAGTSPRRPRRRASALAVAIPAAVAVVAVLLAACGGSGGASSAQLRQPNSVTVYSSLPMHGTSGAVGNDVVSGIELALTEAHGRAGRFRVIYGSEQRLDDGSGAAAGWDPSRAAANARRAAADADAVYYIGELEPIASAISMPILKLAGIPQVSLGSLVPGDPVEAAAQLMALRSKGCTKVAVGYDEAQAALAAGIKATAANYGVEIVSETLLRPGLQSEYSFPVSVHQSGADCVVLAGSVAVDHKVLITTRIHQLLPKAWIIGSAGMCTRAWTNAGYGGVLSPVDSFLMCTRPLPIARYPGGAAFIKAFEHANGGVAPGPYALFGYTAMQLGLQAIVNAGREGDDRAAVRSALFSVDHPTALGTFAVEPGGSKSTLSSYGLYRVGHDYDPVYAQTLTPLTGQ